jgi:transcriptional regulator of acetoin/glycerol metabolism
MDDRVAPDKVRLSAVETLIALANRHSIAEKTPLIMQTWMRCLQAKSLQEKLMELLLLLVTVFGNKDNFDN